MLTLAEKILAAHTGKKELSPGDLVSARVDVILANDCTGPLAIQEFRRLKINKVFDPQKIVMVCDHFVPAKDIPAAENAKITRDFCREFGIRCFDVGRMGIEHALLPEQGLVLPGDIAIGADSHTCTYGALGAFACGVGSTDVAMSMTTGDIWMKVPSSIKFIYHGRPGKWVTGKDLILYTLGQIGVEGASYCSMEFTGEAVDGLGMDGRFTMANMTIEAGGKAGLFRVDEKALEYLKPRAKRPYTIYAPDKDAKYARVYEWDVSGLEPQVAFPFSPGNVRPVSQAGNVKIEQAVIGSCTNGRLDDLKAAARILKGRKIHGDVRCIVIPATQTVYLEALRRGIIGAFIEAGAAVSTPTCGPCCGLHTGILAAGERCISTTNRNFVGRMGSPKSEVYLASPAVVAASAVLGRIASPEELKS